MSGEENIKLIANNYGYEAQSKQILFLERSTK